MYVLHNQASNIVPKRFILLSLFSLFLLIILTVSQNTNPLASSEFINNSLVSTVWPQMLEAYGKIPLSFEANQGQVDSEVAFLSRGNGYTMYLTSDEAIMVLNKPITDEATGATSVVRLQLVGANANLQTIGEDKMPGKVNYFIGNDPKQWHTDIPTYSKVRYEDIYPGIDLVYYGDQRQLEYDFVVQPGVDPNVIALSFDGIHDVRIDDSGNLLLSMDDGELIHRKPFTYQEINGQKREVFSDFVLHEDNYIGFDIGAYDASKPLIIDPTVLYATYIGGSGLDLANSIAVDVAGNAYVTGRTPSTNFPVVNSVQGSFGGGSNDAFVTKLDATGSFFIYSTYLGGSNLDEGYGIAVDASGNVNVVGYTASTNFPTANPMQPANAGGANGWDVFLTRIEAGGSTLTYSTYLGGQCDDRGFDIAIDSAGNSYLTGETGNCSTNNFPTVNPFQAGYSGSQDVFVTKMNAAGTGLDYSTYLGGSNFDSGSGIAVDAVGHVYVTGFVTSATFPTLNAFQSTLQGGDAFVTKIDPSQVGAASLLYSTFFGGSGSDEGDDIAVDSSGAAYITGETDSTNFPTQNPIQPTFGGSFADAYVAKLDPSQSGASSLIYSTYLGADGQDRGHGIAVDSAGNAYVTGQAGANFPLVDPLSPTSGAFATKINSAGSTFDYSTYVGGSIGQAIAVDSSGAAYVAGYGSSGIPVVNAAQPSPAGSLDAFVVKISESCTTVVSNLNDNGSGSLREAINCANINPGPDSISFTVVGTINILTQLPALSDSSGGTTIDGTTTPGYAGIPVIVLRGPGIDISDPDGLIITSADNVLRALQIDTFYRAIQVSGSSATNNLVVGSYLGTDGSVAVANSIGISIANAANNVIGGTTVDERNVISGNSIYGILVTGPNASGNVAIGNYVGTDANGTASIKNGSGRGTAGIHISSALDNRIGGTTVGDRNIVSGNGWIGIRISGSSGSGNLVQGNFIGTDATGLISISPNQLGLEIDGAPANTIGGTTAGAGNVISGNSRNGLDITGSGATGNEVQGNFVGPTATGTSALGNSQGIEIRTGASFNVIGGTTSNARNIISGNQAAGIQIKDSTTTGNIVQGNYIGTDVTGSIGLENVRGVDISATNNVIGGTTPGAGNLISGNRNVGVTLIGINAVGNIVQGNLIGPDGTGTVAIGSTQSGVSIIAASENTIGGTTTGARNVISGNSGIAVLLQGSSSTGNIVQNNLIGVDISGNSPLGNADIGVFVSDATDNVIGGTNSNEGNVIAYNGGGGIVAISGTGNGFLSNSIFSNTELGIDLSETLPANGVTANDPDDVDTGVNELQNFPVLTGVTADGVNVTLNGTLDSTPNSAFTLQFFSNSSCDPSGFGEGEELIDTTSVSTDPNGDATFSVTFSSTATPGDNITATATDANNNTSEFSACFVATTSNQPPVADDDSFSSNEDVTLNEPAPGVLDGDTDANGDTLTAVLDTTTTNGTLTLNADGSFDYTPNPNFCGQDTFTYHANDGQADSNVATVTIDVICVNDPPVADNDNYSTNEDIALNEPAPGVLDGDSDVENDPLTAVLDTPTSNGTVNLNSDGSFDYSPDADFCGQDSFAYHANDGTADSNVATVTIDVVCVNDPPEVTVDQATVAVDEGQTAVNSGTFSDVDDTTITLSASVGTVIDNGNGTWFWSFDTDDGPAESQTVTITADDGQDSSLVSFSLVVNNVAPTATFTNDGPVDEGSSFTLSLTSPSDPSSADTTAGFEYAFDCGDSSGFGPFGSSNTTTCSTTDNETRMVEGQIRDKDGGVTEYMDTVDVTNVAPSVDSITVPLDPVNLDDQASFSVDVSFSDPAGAVDEPYTCEFDLDYDGVTFNVDVTVSGVTGTSCSTLLNYTEPGVYTVKVAVTDKDDGTGMATAVDFIVIYDPDSGFVTGGGWIWSEEGWCQLDSICAGAEGKANFGFVSKYKKGANVPTGNTEFNFSAGNLNFHSESYDWLVINQNGANAQYKGSGTINGDLAPNGELFKFMIWATDGDNKNPTEDDTFRIKIWYEDGGEILVYDNGFDQVIGGGNIKIHNGN